MLHVQVSAATIALIEYVNGCSVAILYPQTSLEIRLPLELQ